MPPTWKPPGPRSRKSAPPATGKDGNSTDPANPRLAGQYADYLAKALRDYKSGARKNAIMAAFATTLTAKDIENLSAYFAAQSPVLTARY